MLRGVGLLRARQREPNATRTVRRASVGAAGGVRTLSSSSRLGAGGKRNVMANVLPSTKLGKIQWFQNHIATWTTNVTQIGLVLADVTGVDNAAQAAMDAYTA